MYFYLLPQIIVAQQNFDKTYRRLERKFKREILNKIEKVCTNDPQQFWKMLKELEPKKKSKIPFEVYDDDGNVSSEYITVMDTNDLDLKNNAQCINGLSQNQKII